MTVQRFLHKNPTPDDVFEQNTKLIAEYQKNTNVDARSRITGELLRLNCKITGVVYRKYGNRYSIEELFSVLYEVLHLSASAFDLNLNKSKTSFANYVINRYSSYMQSYMRTSNTIHIPGNRVPDVQHSYVDMESVHIVTDTKDIAEQSAKELDILIDNYIKVKKPALNRIKQLEVMKHSLDLSYTDISEMYGVSRERIRQMRKSAIEELQRFNSQEKIIY